jgi:hypothetical protein
MQQATYAMQQATCDMRGATSLLRSSAALCGGDRHGAVPPFRALTRRSSGCCGTARTRSSRTATRPRRCAPHRTVQRAHVVMQRAYLPGAAPRRAVPRSGGARTEWARVPRVLVPHCSTARWRCDVALPGVLARCTRQVFCESSIDEILMNKTQVSVNGLAHATSAPGLGSPLPTSAGTGLPLPHLHRDWARPCHCTGTALTATTSTPACRRGRLPLAHPPSLRADALTADCARRVRLCGTRCQRAYPSPHGLLQRLVFVCTDPVSKKPAATTVSL